MTIFRFIFFAMILVLFACQKKHDRLGVPRNFHALVPDTLLLMSYNVENLFDMKDDGDEYPEFKPNANNWTQNTFRIKVDNIASVIAAANPDVVDLVEVENENALNELRKRCAIKNCDFPYYAMGDRQSGSNTRPMILSKMPILWEKSFGLFSNEYHERPILEAAIYLGADTLFVFACHWPSKKNTESKRVARAELLKRKLEEVPADQDYVVAGDFNENFDENETFHTAGLDDTKGIVAIYHVLGAKTSRPAPDEIPALTRTIAEKKELRLFDPWQDVPDQDRFSTMYKGRRETPDHFILPLQLFDKKGLSYVNNSFVPFTWNGRLLKDGVPYRWQMRYTKQGKVHIGEGYSDHLPLLMKVRKGPYPLADLPDLSGQNPANPKSSASSGFETGFNGFIAGTSKISALRDTTMKKSGAYSLKLLGNAKTNSCAAKATLVLNRGCSMANSCLKMALFGTGTVNIRCGISKEKQWLYFNNESFSPAKGGKYYAYSFATWKTISLPLGGLPDTAHEFDIEIRSKKNCEIAMWIDDVRVVCR